MGTPSSHRPVSPESPPSFDEPLLPIGSPSVLLVPGDLSSGSTLHFEEIAHGKSYKRATTIDILPDDILLEIFSFWQKSFRRGPEEEWHLLVHVCQRWRQIVFASPRRLNLKILCANRTPFRKSHGIWPLAAIPIVICYHGIDEDELTAALEHPNRICEVSLFGLKGDSGLEKAVTMMRVPFPVLTHVHISVYTASPPVLPAEYLGGSAPCLREFSLRGIPFPSLPTLLLSASALAKLQLLNIPATGYISPEAMAVSLAALPRLCIFHLGFQPATSRPYQIRPPPVTRSVLPALTDFEFRGASEYLEDLVARIDCPQLSKIFIGYPDQPVDSRVDQADKFSKFVDRSVDPEIALCAHVSFANYQVALNLYRHANCPRWDQRSFRTTISCDVLDWQLSHMAHVISQFTKTFSTVVHLELGVEHSVDFVSQGMVDIDWVHLLLQFSAVQTLLVPWDLSEHVALALEDLSHTAEMAAEVLPSLDLIYLDDEPIQKFVAVRQLCGLPVTVADTRAEFDQRLKSYISQ